ncbi:RidA family protein [Paraburkholderia sp. USG1]|uniref:RidA family protein n=1 Tax=Paraburkholderia sp. USG1 TaxID=2952268 RepID=UPI00285BEB9C|nr:RidA family protein [Paraburkholderia sp. USG1]MDR8398372.1 RidA family protein [Paraburkholderia sp. USG1]
MQSKFGIAFDERDILPAGNYALYSRHGNDIHLSGQLPKLGSRVLTTGTIGGDVSVKTGKWAAGICALRALAILRHALGSLGSVERIVCITVYMQCSQNFERHSEIADGASDVLNFVLQDRWPHARTSLGGLVLPRNAAVELELTAIANSEALRLV